MTTKLASLLHHKFAAEMPDKQQFESDFGNLAFSFLRDRAPQLVNHLVGFELVHREDDGSNAVGIFGFQIGGRVYYVHAFWINNQVQGMDSIWDKEADQFYPLADTWVSRIVRTANARAGSGQSLSPTEIRNPDLAVLQRRPGVGGSMKMAEAVFNTEGDFVNLCAKIATAAANDADFSAMLTGADEVGTKAMVTKQASHLISFLRERGGPEAVTGALNMYHDRRWAKAAHTFYNHTDLQVDQFSPIFYDSLKKRAGYGERTEAAMPKVRVITADEIDSGDLSNDELDAVMLDGYAFRDLRTTTEVSQAFKETRGETLLSGVTTPGVQDIITAAGTVVRRYVSRCTAGDTYSYSNSSDPNDGLSGDSSGRYLVIDLEKHEGAVVRGCPISAGGQDALPPGDPVGLLFDKGVSPGDVEQAELWSNYNSSKTTYEQDCTWRNDHQFYLVGTDDTFYGPFCLQSLIKQDDAWVAGTDFRGDYNAFRDGNGRSYCDPKLIFVDRPGNLIYTRVSSGPDRVTVPSKSWKLLRCKMVEQALATGSDALYQLAGNGVHNFKLAANFGDGSINCIVDDNIVANFANRKTANHRLVLDFGFRPDAVSSMLGDLRDSGEAVRTAVAGPSVKRAFGEIPLMPQVGQNGGYESYFGASTQPMTESAESVGDSTLNGVNRDVMQPGANLYQQPAGGNNSYGGPEVDPSQLAADAAASGQQQVFDHATIGNLAQTYDVGYVIDSELPHMLGTLNRLGRMLFLFHWRNKDFAERYGQQDLAGLSDRLRSCYRMLGDLIIKLQQRPIDAGGNVVFAE